MITLSPSFDLIVISPFWFSLHVCSNSDKLVFKLNTVGSTCAVEFYTVVDTSRSPVHNNPCPLHWLRDRQFVFIAASQTDKDGDNRACHSSVHNIDVGALSRQETAFTSLNRAEELNIIRELSPS